MTHRRTAGNTGERRSWKIPYTEVLAGEIRELAVKLEKK
jgi:hypothetical protein